jgi:hypothetical protein
MKFWTLRAGAAIAASVLFAGAASAHHSGTGWDTKPMTLKGTVTEFNYQNPHTKIGLAVTDDAGKVVNWTVEANSVLVLSRNGWTKNSLKPGDEIIVQGPKSLDGEPLVRGSKISRADGTPLHCAASGATDCN